MSVTLFPAETDVAVRVTVTVWSVSVSKSVVFRFTDVPVELERLAPVAEVILHA